MSRRQRHVILNRRPPRLEWLEDRLAPATLTIINAPSTSPEGTEIVLRSQLSFGDPAEGGIPDFPPETRLHWRVFRADVLYAEGFTPVVGGTFAFTPDENAFYDVVVDGMIFVEEQVNDSAKIDVFNVDPTISAGPNRTVQVNDEVKFDSTFVDPGLLDVQTIGWKVTQGGALVASGMGSTFAFTPSRPGLYLVTIDIADDDGGLGFDTVFVLVPAPKVDPPDTPPTTGGPLVLVGTGFFDIDDTSSNSFVATAVSGEGTATESPAAGEPVAEFQGRIDGGGGAMPILVDETGSMTVVPLLASVVGNQSDPAQERAQNLLPVESRPPNRIEGAGGEEMDPEQRHDHVRSRIVQSVASVLAEDDSVGLVETLLASRPVVAVPVSAPVSSPVPLAVPVLLPQDSSGEEQAALPPVLERSSVQEQAVRPWVWIAGGALAFTSLIAGIRLERWRRVGSWGKTFPRAR